MEYKINNKKGYKFLKLFNSKLFWKINYLLVNNSFYKFNIE